MNWRDVVDLDRLSDWMDAHRLERGAIVNPTLLTGGTQNILLRFTRGQRDFVLRRPPPHTVANGSETMRREARVLGALAGSDVPHPGLIAACPTEDVLGAAFYLMEPIDGFNATVGLPPSHDNAAARRAMGFSLVDGALALGRVDYVAAGLSDMAKLDNYLGKQASRWRAWYEKYSVHEGWTRESLQGVDDVAAWLDANTPNTFTPGIIHGDYHMANVMFRYDRPQLAAIVDWELSSIGDPLIDLGWILATWRDPNEPEAPAKTVEPWEGFPEAGELAAYYAAHTSRETSSLLWYKILGCYKLAILIEGTNARALAGKADREIGDVLHYRAQALLGRACRTIEQGHI